MEEKEEENNNNNTTLSDKLNERLNKIKKNLEKSEEKNEIKLNTISDPKEITKLKEKLKMSNAPPLKEIKDIDKNIQKMKQEFSDNKNNANISKEKFSSFINNANEMFKNYEKQLQYYSIYNGKYNSKDLIICSNRNNITSMNERNFFILADKKKVFENELNKLNININNSESNSLDIENIKKLYQDKIDSLFKENKNLNKVIEKMSNQVIINFQSQINELYTENKDLKKRMRI